MFNLPFESNSFDFVVADQVLEHVRRNPKSAVEELRLVLRPGGTAVVTTCLLNEVHDHPGDYWRFTPYGLRLLCGEYSTIIQCEGWRNKLAFLAFRHFKAPLARWHPLHMIAMSDDPEALISTWFIAQE